MPGTSTGTEDTVEPGPTPDAEQGDRDGGDGPPAGTRPRRIGDGLFPVAAFGSVAAVLMVVVWISANWIPPNGGYPIGLPHRFRGDFLVEGWMRWDGGWYAGIAERGYTYTPGAMSPVAFFPAFPLAIRVVNLVTRDGPHMLPAVLVAFACGLTFVVLLHRWILRVQRRVPARVPVDRTAVWLVLLFPYAYYLYGAAYADSLFLAAAVGSFLLVERDRPLLAGVVATVATAARPVGIGVAVGLIVLVVERRQALVIPYLDRVRELGWRGAWRGGTSGGRVARVLGGIRVHPRRLRPRDAGVLVSLLGWVAWMRYLAVTFGDPLLYVHVESVPGWEQGQGPRTWFKFHWLNALRRMPGWLGDVDRHWDHIVYNVGTSFQAVLIVGALCMVPAVVRRVGLGYAVYVVAVVTIPILGTKDWQGTGRYVLAAFPVFVVVAGWLLERPAVVRRAVFTAGAVLLVFFASSFARGFYLA